MMTDILPITEMIYSLKRVDDTATIKKYSDDTRELLPIISGKTVDELTKHLHTLRYLSLVLCGYVSPNTLPVVRYLDFEDSLKKHQNLERLSSIVDCEVHTTTTKRCVVVLKIRMTKAFDTYAANAFLTDNFNTSTHRDALFIFSSLEEDGDYYIRTFITTFITRLVIGDIKMGFVSATSLLESIKRDIRSIDVVLEGVQRPHPLGDSVCMIKSKNITIHRENVDIER